jgi:hypothetical protein
VGEGGPENRCNFLTAIYDLKKIANNTNNKNYMD